MLDSYTPLSVAPMLDWTDRHCRYFHRLLAPHATLYTEMITTGALLHGQAQRFLDFNEEEHPVVLQLGGCDPNALAKCAKLARDHAYDAVNLNIGCPSDRVQSARFGACLMADPNLVADCVKAMQDAVDLPITVKTRIGIDEHEDYDFLKNFVEAVNCAGCETIIVHARKAWLKGLSPKQNREIPPLHYERVYAIKRDFPDMTVIINGGIKSLETIPRHLESVDGVMLGRLAYQQPYALAEIEQHLFGTALPSRFDIVDKMKVYIERQLENGLRLNNITKHMLGLFNGFSGAKHWRRTLSMGSTKPQANVDLLDKALEGINQLR